MSCIDIVWERWSLGAQATALGVTPAFTPITKKAEGK
jgi:hypothetical protein